MIHIRFFAIHVLLFCSYATRAFPFFSYSYSLFSYLLIQTHRRAAYSILSVQSFFSSPPLLVYVTLKCVRYEYVLQLDTKSQKLFYFRECCLVYDAPRAHIMLVVEPSVRSKTQPSHVPLDSQSGRVVGNIVISYMQRVDRMIYIHCDSKGI